MKISHHLSEIPLIRTFSYYKKRCPRMQDLSRKPIWSYTCIRQLARLACLLYFNKDFQEGFQSTTTEQYLHIFCFGGGWE